MSGSILFVHGTAVRHERYTKLLEEFTNRIQSVRPGVKVQGHPWFHNYGTPSGDATRALPPELRRGASAPDQVAESTQTWQLLVQDPMLELRFMAASAPSSAMVRVGVITLEDAVTDRLLRASRPDLADTDLNDEAFEAARQFVAHHAVLHRAARAVGTDTDPAFVHAAARAVVARAITEIRLEPFSQPRVLVDASVRDRLVNELAKGLAPSAMGFRSALLSPLAEMSKELATTVGAWTRATWMGPATLFSGDIARYMRHSEDMLNNLKMAIDDLEPPVVAVGHSLGGIMLVDLLSRPQSERPTVDLLVTVGSQSPLLYLYDALAYLRRDGTGSPFTPWVNMYDPADFLSFCVEDVFPDIANVQDVRVDNGVPFPDAHSAYWENDKVYQVISQHWPSGKT